MRTYEELTGARGSRVYYRAERFQARDLFSRKPPLVAFGGNEFELDNISMTGLAASRKGEVELSPKVTDDVAIVFEGDNEPLFHSKGRLERVEQDVNATRVALSFTGAPLDVPNLVSRYNESLLRRDLNGGLHHTLQSVAPEYRQHCVDVLHLLRRYKATLEKFRLSETETADREAILYDLCEQRLLPEWRTLWHQGNALVRPLMDDPELLQATKAFTEDVLTPEFMVGHIWERSYRKPLGYPGDYLVMNRVYGWLPQGDGLYPKLVDRIGLEVAECIATRMVMVQHAIAESVSSVKTAEHARVLSLGCGPAQEVQNYLDQSDIARPIEATLVDQDELALSYAYERIFPKVMARDDGSSVRCLQVSFVELMKIGKIFKGLPPQDLIYTVGLVDYLSPRRVQDLTFCLYQKLAPGGRLIIGNMADVETGNLWPMEFICDWNLHYRTKAEMREFTALLPAEVKHDITPDPTGRVYMLEIRKPPAGG
ncbi:MAG TPA: hypothetical protein VLS27_10430 [Gammaproteobacteria bacterium]|nr:hypothetical protein [Gammaproteobacteria bacterium]